MKISINADTESRLHGALGVGYYVYPDMISRDVTDTGSRPFLLTHKVMRLPFVGLISAIEGSHSTPRWWISQGTKNEMLPLDSL